MKYKHNEISTEDLLDNVPLANTLTTCCCFFLLNKKC